MNTLRIRLLFLFFVLWGIFIFFYLIYFNFFNKNDYLKASNKYSFYEGIVPAKRGSIYDYNGKKIVWSDTQYNIILDRKLPLVKKEEIIERLKLALSEVRILDHKKNNQYSVHNLSKQQIEKILAENDIENCIQVKPRYIRCHSCGPKAKKILGEAYFNNEKWIGYSGVEKKYNNILNGRNGTFSVLIDKTGNWIYGTFKQIKNPISGEDIYLDKSFRKILK